MKMDNSNTALNKILSNLQVKYNHYNNLFNLTKQLEEVFKMNDEVSIAATLNMRQKVMLIVDKLDAENRLIVSKLPKAIKERMTEVLFPKGDPVRLENALETNIFDTNKRNLTLLKKIIDLDDKVNKIINKR
ncbi:hypothetical protein [Anaerovorax odorimutans]|uniref:hypothetical protein n=1 Tax=Anaerovorax odorimutans TaxID=109327 RepID=UPI00040C5029|nr:hypothetical protein [Anaerovorax odorimutans]